METKSGAQKLSDFGSQLGESSQTATRLDGESMQGESTGQMLGADKKAKQAMGIIVAVGGLNLAMGLAILFELYTPTGGSGDAWQMLAVGVSFLGLAMWARRDPFSGTLGALTMYAGYRVVSIVMSGYFDVRGIAFTVAIIGALAFAVRETHRSLVGRGRRPEMVKPLAVGGGLLAVCVLVSMMTVSAPKMCGDQVCPETADVDDEEAPPEATPAEPAEPAVKASTKATTATPAKTKPEALKPVTTKAVNPAKTPAKATAKATKAPAKGKAATAKATAKGKGAKVAKAPAKKGKAVAKAPAKAKAKGKTKPH
jgi:hypothetical protein